MKHVSGLGLSLLSRRAVLLIIHHSNLKSDISTKMFNNNWVKQHANNYAGKLEQPIRTCSVSVSPARQTASTHPCM